jgi:hypothetical protein
MTAFSQFIARHANAKTKRYFVRTGEYVSHDNGFATKAQASDFIKLAEAEFGRDWRAGWLFRLRGIEYNLEIVDRQGKAPKL